MRDLSNYCFEELINADFTDYTEDELVELRNKCNAQITRLRNTGRKYGERIPHQIGQRWPPRPCPVVLCPACGSPEIKGNYDFMHDRWSIQCTRCGTEMEIPSVGTDLESACELLNRSERLRYEVNKVKEEGKNLCK